MADRHQHAADDHGAALADQTIGDGARPRPA
jgi:hypothetical protein